MPFYRFILTINPKRLVCNRCNQCISFNHKFLTKYYLGLVFALIIGIATGFIGDGLNFTKVHTFIISLIVVFCYSIPIEIYFYKYGTYIAVSK